MTALFYPLITRLALTCTLSTALFNPAFAAVFDDHSLTRQANLGLRTAIEGDHLHLSHVPDDGPAARAGLQAGDRIIAINDEAFSSADQVQTRLEQWRGGQPLRLRVQRGEQSEAQEMTFRYTPAARAYEAIPEVDSYYRSVQLNDGSQLRAIITRPQGQQTPLPPLIFTQWVSCHSIEYRANSSDSTIMAALAQHSGRSIIRVERSSSGDSLGPACHELDYHTELRHYLEAYSQLLRDPLVAAAPVLVYGSSLGSTVAPLLAQSLQQRGFSIAGVIVQGGGALTHYERMVNFDRLYLERREHPQWAQIHHEMLARARFHYEYLVRQRHPDQVAQDDEQMAAVRRDVRGLEQGTHYGRPYTWHQQAAQQNFLAAWLTIEAPVLVIYNEFDQFEMRYGHYVIVDALNQLRPGSASYVTQARTGHDHHRYRNRRDAYAWRDGQPYARETAQAMLDWIQQQVTAR